LDIVVFLASIIISIATAIPVLLQIRKHPKGLFILFFAEMWERFSFYGMRGLLVFYLTQHFLFNDTAAQGQYGAYNALVYLTPLLGGLLADRLLGTRKAIAFGALLLVAGHFTMAIEGPPAIQILNYHGASYEFNVNGSSANRIVKLKVGNGLYDFGSASDGGFEIKNLPAAAPLPSILPRGSYELTVKKADPLFQNIMFLALSLIVLGVGFLKPNISSIVGQLYGQYDPRRDPGFTLYYYGINLGAFWAGILCGWLGQNIGWWAGFGAAGVGMALGWIVFVWGKPLLEGKGEPRQPERLKQPLLGPINTEWTIYLAAIPALVIIWFLVQNNAHVGYILGAGSIAILVYIGLHIARECTKIERERIFLALILIATSVVFWTLFEQAGSSLNQFAERNTDLTISVTQSVVTAAQTQAFQPGLLLVFAPVFAALWTYLGSRGRDPNPVVKFGSALVQVGAGFFILVWGAEFADTAYKVPLIFLFLAYLLHTTGELCLSPVGLSQMTKLSTPKIFSTLMAVWFLAFSWAQWIGGLVAQLTASETAAGQVLDPGKALATYVHVFFNIASVSVVLGFLMMLSSPWLKKWAHGASDTKPLETKQR
jgi:POT family proton-dependent oligopeptide transporter